MTDLVEISRGIAALLKAVLPEDEGHVSAWWTETPKLPCLQIAGISEAVPESLTDEGGYTFRVEGVCNAVSLVAAQKLIYHWVAVIPAAVEMEMVPAGKTGKLFSRLSDENIVTDGHDGACDSIAWVKFNGIAYDIPRGILAGPRQELVTATWDFLVLA